MIQEAFNFYKPCKLLQPYVRYYWVLSSNQMLNTYTYTFPIGCPQIIFHKRTPLYIPELGTTQSKLTISGQVNFSSHLRADDDIEMIVVVFHPHTINMFLNAPASSFYNQEISGYDIEDEQLNELAMQVFECEDNSFCVNLIENWLLDRLSNRSYDTIYRVNRMNVAIEQLLTASQTPVTDLSSTCCLSKKQFDREFNLHIGMNSGIFNNPFIIWGRYKKRFFRYYLTLSFQFHHTQMDGAHAGKFLANLQNEINRLA